MAPSSNLHVLRTPPAFILSQDQTLSEKLTSINLHDIYTLYSFVKFLVGYRPVALLSNDGYYITAF